MTFFLLLALAVQGLVFYITPQMTRPGIFFAVTVDPQVRSMREGRQLMQRYRMLVVAASVVAALSVLVGGAAMFAATLIQTAGGIGAWIFANRRARHFAVPREPLRTAALAPREVQLPGGWLFFVGPLMVMAAVAFYLAVNWEAIPEQIPVHWGIDGQPDRWEPRGFGSVFRPLLTAIITCGWMLGLAWYTIHSPSVRSGWGPECSRRSGCG